ncbi:MAG: AEC family transporter [Armatimonadetes bacterium]|nr:AEC family transporter [Armatimonadota bacterium]
MALAQESLLSAKKQLPGLRVLFRRAAFLRLTLSMATVAPIFSTFLLLLVGFALRKGRILKQGETDTLNAVIIFATVPALAFTIMYGQKLSWSAAAVVVGGNLANLVSLAVAWSIARALKLSRPRTGAFMIAATFGNTTFMGIPIIAAAFHGSKHALLYGIVYGELAMSLPVYTLGLWVASHFGGAQAHMRELLSIKRLPAIPALFAGLVLSGVTVPGALMDVIKSLGACTLPLSMISVGVMLSGRSFRGNGALIVCTGILKLFCMPLIVYAILTLFGVGGLTRQVATLQAAMPNSIISNIMTVQGGSDGNLVSSATLATTIASVATLPLVLMALR